jgi:hypothetical protein
VRTCATVARSRHSTVFSNRPGWQSVPLFLQPVAGAPRLGYAGLSFFYRHFRIMRPIQLARVFFAAMLAVFGSTVALAQDSNQLSGPAVNQPCMECGVIYEIKTLTSEREVARTVEERAPPAGPFINIPLGRNPVSQPSIGAIGDKKMRSQFEETTYEIVVRFDDDRFQRLETRDVSGLYVGDRVRVRQNRVERIE